MTSTFIPPIVAYFNEPRQPRLESDSTTTGKVTTFRRVFPARSDDSKPLNAASNSSRLASQCSTSRSSWATRPSSGCGSLRTHQAGSEP